MSATQVFSKIIFLMVITLPYGQFKTAKTTKKPGTPGLLTYRTLVCEHVTAVILCPTKFQIKIIWGDYGRWNTISCPNKDNLASDNNINCRTGATAQSILIKTCNGKNSCAIPSWFQFMNNNVDPCGGTWKYVNMTHQCVPAKKKSTKSRRIYPVKLDAYKFKSGIQVH